MTRAAHPPTLSTLRAFEAAARTLSFSAAGRELNVTHAAIGQHVRRLEAHLDRPLLVRAGRGLALTPDGAALALRLGEGFAIIRDALAEMEADDAARPLNITTTPMFAVNWLMPRLGRFRAAHPDVELMLNPTPQLLDMSARIYDLGIRYGGGNWPGLDCTTLTPTHFVVVATPEVAARVEKGGRSALLDLPWVQESGTDELARWLADQGLGDRPPSRVSDLPGYMVLPALLQSQGAACVTRLFVEAELQSGALVALHEDPDPDLAYHLVRRPGPMRPPLRAFVAWLKREAAAAAA